MPLGRSGKYFLIFSQLNDSLVLESDLTNEENVKVSKYIRGYQKDNQLWFYNSFQKKIFNKKTLMSLEADGNILKLSKSANNINNLTFDTSFICQQTTNLVVELVGGSSLELRPKSNNDNLLQMWKITSLPALYFFIKSRSKPNLVVDVRGDSKASGAKVILYERKNELSDNQLWCEDERGRLRSKMNDFLIDMNRNNEMVMNPYLSGNNSGWVVDGGCRIVNGANSNLVMSHKPGGLFAGGPKVIATTRNACATEDALWDFDFPPQQSISLSHVGLGKEFMIRNRGTGKTIDVKGDAVLNGSELRLVFSNVLASKAPSKQLFYFDELTGTIRNCQRNFVIEATDKGLILTNFDPYNKMQGWMYQDHKLINRSALKTLLQSDPQDNSMLSVGLDKNLDTQHWELCHVPAKCFFIESILCDKVIDVRGDNADAGAEVILYERKTPTSINQLWYEDEHGILRSKLNGYVFDTSQEKVKLEPYKPQSMDQQWVIAGDRIENCYDNTMVIDIKGESRMNSTSLIKYKFHGGENQRWRIIYQEDS